MEVQKKTSYGEAKKRYYEKNKELLLEKMKLIEIKPLKKGLDEFPNAIAKKIMG